MLQAYFMRVDIIKLCLYIVHTILFIKISAVMKLIY